MASLRRMFLMYVDHHVNRLIRQLERCAAPTANKTDGQ